MATKSKSSEIVDGVQVALDASETAVNIAEEFNNVREQFEVVNIQAKRIYQSVSIIFVSSIAAAIISLGAGMLMYYKTLGTLRTNSNMAIESLAIFTENVSSLDQSIKTIQVNTENQEIIKKSLTDVERAASAASKDISGAEKRYNQAIKIGVQETERMITQFAESTLIDLKTEADATQMALSEQIREIQKFFNTEQDDEMGSEASGDNVVTLKEFQKLSVKVDQLIALQKDLAAGMMEMNRLKQAELKKKATEAKPVKSKKPAINPLKFP